MLRIVLRSQHRLASNHSAIKEADLMEQHGTRHVAVLKDDSIVGSVMEKENHTRGT